MEQEMYLCYLKMFRFLLILYRSSPLRKQLWHRMVTWMNIENFRFIHMCLLVCLGILLLFCWLVGVFYVWLFFLSTANTVCYSVKFFLWKLYSEETTGHETLFYCQWVTGLWLPQTNIQLFLQQIYGFNTWRKHDKYFISDLPWSAQPWNIITWINGNLCY